MEGKEKKARDQRRKILNYAATALSVGAGVAGAVGGSISLNTLMRRQNVNLMFTAAGSTFGNDH